MDPSIPTNRLDVASRATFASTERANLLARVICNVHAHLDSSYSQPISMLVAMDSINEINRKYKKAAPY